MPRMLDTFLANTVDTTADCSVVVNCTVS